MLGFTVRRLFSILMVSFMLVFLIYLGMEVIMVYTDNWQGWRPELDPDLLAPDLPRGFRLFSAATRLTFTFFQNVFRGDLGQVYSDTVHRYNQQPLLELLWFWYRNSLGLVLLSLSAAVCLGIPVGAAAALTHSTQREYLMLTLTVLGISAPSFLLAVVLQQIGIWITTAAGKSLISMGGYTWDFKHLLLPILVMSARPLAFITRATFINLNQILEQDFIRTAHAKGLHFFRVVIVHAFRNLLIPVLAAIGVSFRFLLASLPLVEYIFAWPGLGQKILEGVRAQVPIQVVTIALVLALNVQLVSFLLDFFYKVVDPRLTVGEAV